MNLFLSESFILIILGIIIVYNLFISNLQKKYAIAKENWGYETVKQRRLRGVFLIFFMIISIVLLGVAFNTIYEESSYAFYLRKLGNISEGGV